MGFDSGSMSFRMFYLPKGLPEDCIERFSKHAAPSLAALDREGIHGWVTGHHLLDREITHDRAYMSGYLYLNLMKAELKIPATLLTAECKMGELVRLRDEGVPFITRAMRSEIKKEVLDRLLPDMPPTLTGIPIVVDDKENMIYAGAMSDKQIDAIVLSLREVLGQDVILMTPAAFAMKRKKLHIRDINPTSFSPECDDDKAGDNLGQDFLTWLWFFAEKKGGITTFDKLGQFGVFLEGPLTFVREGGAANVAVLRKGMVLTSAEAKTSLLSGKKLKSAKLNLVRNEEVWSTTIDANDFVFRGLKMPKTESPDPAGRFQERMLLLTTFKDAFLAFFDKFIELRGDPKVWRDTQKEIHTWVTSRDGVS